MKKLLLVLILSLSSISVANSQSQEPISVVQQTQKIENLKAYPNPFISETIISFQSHTNRPTQLIVKNLLGKIVYSEEITTHIGINNLIFYKDNLESGMYIYTLQTTSDSVSKRLVIK